MDGEGNNNGNPTMAWDKICRPKSDGGLGIRKTIDVSTNFLAKQGWKTMQPDNIWYN